MNGRGVCCSCLFVALGFSFSIIVSASRSIHQRTLAVFDAPQLKNYEQAVIEKRFSELEEEEVDALLDEVNEQ